jgi:hypothetical protein
MRYATLILVFIAAQATAQHNIHFKINGLKDVTVHLGRYADNAVSFCDTVTVSHKGDLIFGGNENLPEGLYFISLNQNKLFEFVVGENQFFDMTTSTEDYIKNMKVENDEDNMLFFESLVFNMELYKEAEPLLKTVNDPALEQEKRRVAQMHLNKIKLRSIAYQDEVIENFPQSITAKLIKSAREAETSITTDGAHVALNHEWYQSHLGLF